MELLFSYGTLQLENVQLSLFGRRLEGFADDIISYKLSDIEIKDEKTVELSGKSVHSIASYTGNPADFVAGMAYFVTHDELLQADAYEVSDYERVEVSLRSGKKAWVYLRK